MSRRTEMEAEPEETKNVGRPDAGGDAHEMNAKSGSGNLAALAQLENPVSSLPPAAQRVLNGAMQVVVSKGFGRLTLQNISAASGENVAAVRYYFGNKAGLIDVMLQTVAYNEVELLTRPRRRARTGTELNRLASDIQVLSTPDRFDKILIELLPHAMRDKKLRQYLQRYYEIFYATFLEMHLGQRGGTAGDSAAATRMTAFAALLTAIADGLTIQAMVAPQEFDFAAAVRALDELIDHGVPKSGDPESD